MCPVPRAGQVLSGAFTHFVAQSARDFAVAQVPLIGGGRLHADAVHLRAAVDWLVRSIDACDGVASSKGYRIGVGWMPAYPETSGYIIPTLLALARELDDAAHLGRAQAIAAWLVSIQRPDGGWAGRELGEMQRPIVFNTAMVLLGLTALLEAIGDESLRAPARRASRFLVASMDADGRFSRNLSHDIPHAYTVRAAWPLMAFGRLDGDAASVTAAASNMRWTLAQQQPNGFFANNSFKPGEPANSHGIAYVLRGLLELHLITGDESALRGVRLAADRLLALYGSRRRIAAQLGPRWQPLCSHVCLSGCAQLAVLFFKLFDLTEDERYLNAALGLTDDVAASQHVGDGRAPHHGGIKGSQPIYGRYAPLQYPNWATKFFIDALLAKKSSWPAYAHRAAL